MMNPNLNDREAQVCKVGLKMFLDELLSSTADTRPNNEFDILDRKHSKAHVITALQKFGIDVATLQK